MSIVSLSVKRPVTVIMFFLLCALMGALAWTKLPRELFPPLSFPQLSIVTIYPNAAPEEIENLITKIVEESIGTVKNLKRVTSISKEGVSLVTAEFSWSTDMNFASLWVREKLDQVKERLPPESKEPLVVMFDPFSEPVILLNITGDMSSGELLQVSKKIIKDRLEKTEGVAAVEISGGDEEEILVEVDQGRLQAAQLSLSQIVDAVQNTNINYPAGTAKEKMFEYLVRTIGEYHSLEDIGRTTIELADYDSPKYRYRKHREKSRQINKKDRRIMRLSEVASVHWKTKDKKSYSRYNKTENISIAVRKRSEANTIITSRNIKRTVKNLAATLKPHRVSIEIIYDQAEFITKSINGLVINALQGGILAFIVILIFLKSFRMALIVSIAIPVSIMITLTLMLLSKLTINMMSLGGLALGVGMLVDNAIVVIENIFRHRADDGSLKDASVQGAQEVAAAITSSTLTSVAVFLPLIFVIGIAGQIFRELSLTVIFSLLASLIVAISLIPRLASTSNISSEPDKKMLWLTALIARFMPKGKDNGLQKRYRTAIVWVLDHRLLFLGSVFGVFVVSILAAGCIQKSFLPRIDQGQFLIHIDLPVGTRLSVTNRVAGRIESTLSSFPQIKSIMTQVGSSSEKAIESLKASQAQIVVSLYRSKGDLPPEKKGKVARFDTTPQLMDRLRGMVKELDLEEAQITYTMQDSLFKSIAKKSAPIVIEVKGPDMDELKAMTGEISRQLKQIPGVINVRDDRPLSSPETRINVDKDKAAISNLSVADIARTGLIGLKGMVASTFKKEGTEYDIRVRLQEKDRKNIRSLDNLIVSSPDGFNLYLKQVATIQSGVGPSQIRRVDQQRTIAIYADLAATTLQKASIKVAEIIEPYKQKIGYSVYAGGEKEKIRESFISLVSALIMAIILVYMIMAAQFESLFQPFIILFTIPLALIGMVAALLITHTSINAISMMGFIILGGIVVNNGIVLIDYANQLLAKGVAVREAVIQACETRFRPIIMTMATTVLGLFPLALGLGEGAELRAPMAITVIGGLLVSTALTLGVIPILYLFVEERKNKGSESAIKQAASSE